ncbi:IS6 family transposase [Roseomonas sp. SSH11]|uniref:IS6 family transposase n=1 Tax=Pararoseomonas baculiformis TaxID=2820812 RepID=A0ABS4ALD1_9PROT|nr:DDE-type integrase/transposase/recombinase [Pararoseomonas baculiformis]MBP0447827.1 IS6 family transposase [Pararoseomonas baculiformis]
MRDVELIVAAQGVVVSYDTIREWGLRFGRLFANTLWRHRPRPGERWSMDEVFIRIRGQLHYLWRAVDQDGNVLERFPISLGRNQLRQSSWRIRLG